MKSTASTNVTLNSTTKKTKTNANVFSEAQAHLSWVEEKEKTVLWAVQSHSETSTLVKKG